MLLVFNKVHANQFREIYLKNLKNEVGSKVQNETEIYFNWTACINGRFEKKLNKFIARLPFEYFAVTVLIHNDKNNNTGKSLNSPMQFKQGNCDAKKIKHVILLDKNLHAAKL